MLCPKTKVIGTSMWFYCSAWIRKIILRQITNPPHLIGWERSTVVSSELMLSQTWLGSCGLKGQLTWWAHIGCRASSTGSGSTHWPQRRCEAVAPPGGGDCKGPRQPGHTSRGFACRGSPQPGLSRCWSAKFRGIYGVFMEYLWHI